MSEISEKTLVPLSLAVTVIGGVTFWLCSMDFRVEAAEKKLQDGKEHRMHVIQLLDSMNTRLSSIEGKVEVIMNQRKK